VGGLSLMESQSITVAWPTATFSATSLAKCCNASWGSADLCGPHSTASVISCLDHGCPVYVGHPSCDHSARSSPAGWEVAMPDGHISPLQQGGSGVEVGSLVEPMWVVHIGV
jgi:hypothetical protein